MVGGSHHGDLAHGDAGFLEGVGALGLFSLWISSFKETSNIVLDLL